MESWTISEHGAVAVVTFTRPPRNFMSIAAMGDLGVVLADLSGRDDISLVVLTGGVDGYFVAHADLDDLTRIGGGQAVEGDPFAWFRTLRAMETMPQPVVAAVNGQAWGGGCELALACTLRLASSDAHFSQPEVSVGIIPGAGGTQRLPRAIGPGKAAELILSGRVIDAAEAERIGLVQAVLPADGFLDAALAWLEPIATKPRHALVAAKHALLEGLDLPLDEGLRREGQLFVECQTRDDTLALQREALRRYAEAGDDDSVFLD